MTATAFHPTSLIPVPRSPVADAVRLPAVEPVERPDPTACRAVAYQRVLHQLVRRELRLLGGLSPSARVAWRVHGRRNYRAAVVKLRGAPPAP
jgi:hypothetical protein